MVGLANHTLLIRKDGSEIPIDDSGRADTAARRGRGRRARYSSSANFSEYKGIRIRVLLRRPSRRRRRRISPRTISPRHALP